MGLGGVGGACLEQSEQTVIAPSNQSKGTHTIVIFHYVDNRFLEPVSRETEMCVDYSSITGGSGHDVS